MDYFVGDLHFGGEEAIQIYGREFKSAHEMTNKIIENWNKVVKDEDRVFIVGDVFDDKGHYFMKDVVNQLKGKKILIMGSHDVGLEDELKELGLEVIEFPIIYNDIYIISHEPVYVSQRSPFINIFAHAHDNPIYRSVSSKSFCVSAERLAYTPISFDKIKGDIACYSCRE